MIERFVNVYNLSGAETSAIWVTYLLAAIGSSVLGSISIIIKRLPSLLYLWMALGTVSSLLPTLLNTMPYVWSFALGASWGIGMPLCLAFFADSSAVENRGRMGGITFLGIYLGAALLSIALSLLDLTQGFVVLAIWRGAGLLSFALLKPKFIATEKKESVSFLRILKDKTLRLYLIPWIMFILIDRFEASVLASYSRSAALSSVFLMGPIIGSFSALFGGLLSDWIGRKKIMMSGFVALGLAYAVIGLAPEQPASWYFYAAIDGFAWGILLVTFLLTLLGDLSQSGGREKYYLIGGIPFYFTSNMLQSFFASIVAQISESASFSLASFFLFIAVLPLLYAPETLPQKKIELRHLKGYIEQAKKIKEKAVA
jgi:MFS family permease